MLAYRSTWSITSRGYSSDRLLPRPLPLFSSLRKSSGDSRGLSCSRIALALCDLFCAFPIDIRIVRRAVAGFRAVSCVMSIFSSHFGCFYRRSLILLLILGLGILSIGGFLETWALYTAKSPVVQLRDENFRQLVLDSSETWLVEFYAPWCGHCRNLAPTWEKAARRLEGIVRVGAVDCEKHRALAQEYGVQAFPTIKLFSGRKGTNNRQHPTEYRGGRSLKDIVRFARRSLAGYVHTVEPSGIDAFFNDEPTKAHVLLVTNSKGTSRIYRALSERHVDRAVFGVLHVATLEDASVKAFFQKLGEQPRVPTILGVPAGAKQEPGMTAVLKDREKMGADALDAFVKRLLAKQVPLMTTRSTPTSVANHHAKQRSPSSPAATSQENANWSTLFGKECIQNPRTRFCVALVQTNASPLLETLSEKYLHDGVYFVGLDDGVLRQHMELPPNTLAVLIRARKRRVAVLETDPASTTSLQEQIGSFIDRALGGDLHYRALSDVLRHQAQDEKDEL
jgi:protein disulfide-isomerase-like protein